MRLKGALSLPGEEIERQFYGCLFHLISQCFHYDLPFAVEHDFAPNLPFKKKESVHALLIYYNPFVLKYKAF
jgi:hypothetical protein